MTAVFHQRSPARVAWEAGKSTVTMCWWFPGPSRGKPAHAWVDRRRPAAPTPGTCELDRTGRTRWRRRLQDAFPHSDAILAQGAVAAVALTGRVAQRESTRFTPGRSAVRTRPRPLHHRLSAARRCGALYAACDG